MHKKHSLRALNRKITIFLGISRRFDIGIPNYNEPPAATNSSSDEHEVILQAPPPFGKEICENHSVNENPGPLHHLVKETAAKIKLLKIQFLDLQNLKQAIR
jgi:hypothetical protein